MPQGISRTHGGRSNFSRVLLCRVSVVINYIFEHDSFDHLKVSMGNSHFDILGTCSWFVGAADIVQKHNVRGSADSLGHPFHIEESVYLKAFHCQ
jgi:hypothetical protein